MAERLPPTDKKSDDGHGPLLGRRTPGDETQLSRRASRRQAQDDSKKSDGKAAGSGGGDDGKNGAGETGKDQSGGKEGEDSQGPGQDGNDPKKRSKKPLIILACVVTILLIGAGIYSYLTRNQESTDDAYTEGNAVTMAPKVSGYITRMNINDNSFVHAGDLLVEIDPRDYINARETAAANLQLAKAQLLGAQANYDIAKVRFPAQLAQAEAQRQQSEATRFQADQEYQRQHSVNQRATTQENIDVATAQQRSAAGQVAQSQAQIEIAKPIGQYLRQAEAQVKQLEAQVAQAQAQLDQAELNLSWTQVRAPQDGWVTRRNVQLGTYLQAGQSMFQLVTTEVWIIANFKETQLDRVRIGQQVDISVDAYPGLKLHGHIDTIQMGSGSRFSAFPAENATGNFVKIVQRVPVKIVLNTDKDGHTTGDWPMLPIGLSVEPTIRFETTPGEGKPQAFVDFRQQGGDDAALSPQTREHPQGTVRQATPK